MRNPKHNFCVGIPFDSPPSHYVYEWEYDEAGNFVDKKIYGHYPQFNNKMGYEIEESLKKDPNSPYPPKS